MSKTQYEPSEKMVFSQASFLGLCATVTGFSIVVATVFVELVDFWIIVGWLMMLIGILICLVSAGFAQIVQRVEILIELEKEVLESQTKSPQ